MTRILLTGAGGFIGHHTLGHFLKNTDGEIVCLESFRNKGLSSRIREILEENESERHRVTVIYHDLKAPIDSITAAKIGSIDVIVNIASESHVDRSIENPRPFVENNVMLMLTMLEYARQLPDLKLFVQVSTDEVYGPVAEGTLHKEYDTPLPSNPYSASKASQEAIAISYWRTYDIPVVITNTMNNIGERQDPEKFVPKVIKKLMAGEKVPVHAQPIENGWLAGSRGYLHAINHADAILFIVKNAPMHPLKKSQGAERPLRFHVPGTQRVANDEMVDLIANFMGITESQIEYQDYEQKRPGHDPNYGLEPGTLHAMGWEPPVPFIDGLKRTVDWTVANPAWVENEY
jgi:dTDP-glucose 4,6-dehydratase